MSISHYIPIVTTVFSAYFAWVLFAHWRHNPKQYLLWWAGGVAMYGIGTLTESLTTLFGWNIVVFKTWYISGALLGGAPLAQGTVYLLMKKRTADRLAVLLASYIAIAAVFVALSPVDLSLVDGARLTGSVMTWSWVRAFSPLVNLYAVVFLAGGAAWSAWRYWRSAVGTKKRVLGNTLIALGAIAPGIGGAYARAGQVEVLYVTEIIGILLIWAGYRLIVGDRGPTIHRNQGKLERTGP